MYRKGKTLIDVHIYRLNNHSQDELDSIHYFIYTFFSAFFHQILPIVGQSFQSKLRFKGQIFFSCFLSTDEVESPTDLQFFEVSDKKIVLTWSAPPSGVSGYRVTVVPVDESGSSQPEMNLPTSQNSYTEVTHLQPGTLYRLSVYAIHNGKESLPLIGEQSTSEYDRWPQVRPQGSGYTFTILDVNSKIASILYITGSPVTDGYRTANF